MVTPDLHGVARTLLVPLACCAIESVRPDAILHDLRAFRWMCFIPFMAKATGIFHYLLRK